MNETPNGPTPKPPVTFGRKAGSPRVQPPSGGRKRGATVTLLALGAGAAAFYAFSGEKKQETPVAEEYLYKSAAECRADGKIPGEECEKFWNEAAAAHALGAPQFATQQDCTSTYGEGNCTAAARPGGGSVFLPMIAGVMIGRLASGAWQSASLYRSPGDAPGHYRPGGSALARALGPQPLPQEERRGTGSSSSSSSTSGGSYWSRARTPAATATAPAAVARGGFGTTARSYSSGSSSRSST